jgi:hypothetical protein
VSQEKIDLVIDELIAFQHKKLMELGTQIIPTLTEEDLMQPMDFPDLEYNPEFRYQEGILQGMHSVRQAILAKKM